MASFTRPTVNSLIVRIENDLISRLTGTIPLLSRALLKILSFVLGGAWDAVYGHQEFISINMIIDRAEGIFLRRWAFQWQIDIQEATFANGTTQVAGTDTTVIPFNTLLVRNDGIEYLTTAPGTITGGIVDIPVQCTTEGTIGNAPNGTILALSSPIIGANDDTTLTGLGAEGGVEADTNAIILRNLLNRIQNPPMGGSANDYQVIAEGVAGVDRAFAFENRAGLANVLGSVTTVVKGIDPIVPSISILEAVETAIKTPTFKPLTASIFVQGIDSRAIVYDIFITPDNTIIKDNITQNLIDQLNADAIPGGTILIAHIRNAISTAGVNDFLINTIVVEGQGSVPVDQNIVFKDFEYPFVDSITFSLLP